MLNKKGLRRTKNGLQQTFLLSGVGEGFVVLGRICLFFFAFDEHMVKTICCSVLFGLFHGFYKTGEDSGFAKRVREYR